MIRPLRHLHRRAFASIAVAVPALLLAGLAGRAPLPAPASLDAPPTPANPVFESEQLWQSAAITTRILWAKGAESQYTVELKSSVASATPDVLLYWSTEDSPGTLSESATLLGPYSGGRARFPLPAGADAHAGMLILYSHAHQVVLATAEVPGT